MKYRRKKQLTIILILVAVISSISIGFAAFSATLNISSSANVTPNSASFSLLFSSSSYAITTSDNSATIVSGTGSNGAQGGITGLYRKYATGLTAQFTEPGQSLSTTIYVHNNGEYDAYLTGVNISNINGSSYKKCTAVQGTTDTLVQAACNGVNIAVSINGYDYSWGQSISNHKIAKGESQPVVIVISYSPTASRADGNFNIEFGDITLEYSTVGETGPKILTFSTPNNTYSYEEGMTWEEWLNSEYNTDNSWYDQGICFGSGGSTFGNITAQTIISNDFGFSTNSCPELGELF